MSGRPAVFRQRDLTKAIRGALAAGQPVARAEIDSTGKIVLVFGSGSDKIAPANEWDNA